jgi:Tfp pilus assembly protein PilF
VVQLASPVAAVLLALGLAAGAVADDSSSRPPSKEQIAEWIKGLQSDSFDEREKASKALWKAGQAAESALRQVLKDGDAEAVRRARDILAKFDWGIYPDTPEAVVGLIAEYRSGTPESQAAIVPKLMDHGSAGYSALMKIASMEKEATVRAQIWALVTADLPRLAGTLLAEGQERRLEEILEQGLTGEGDQPHANYAAYWMARGKLDEQIRALEKKAAGSTRPSDKTALTLAYVCRARGDLAAARKYANEAGHAMLRLSIPIEQEDWEAAREELESQDFVAELAQSAGLRLTLRRLIGDRKGFEADLAKLAKQEYDDRSGPLTLPTFLLNGRIDDAMAWLKKHGTASEVAGLFAARLRFREALDVADKMPPTPDATVAIRFHAYKAGLLARIGERKQASELFEKALAAAKPEEEPVVLEAVIVAEQSAGLKEEAFSHAARLLSRAEAKEDAEVLNTLFPPSQIETGVQPWWTFLRRKFDQDDAAATLKRLRDLLGRKLPARDVAALLRDLADEAAKLPPEERERWLHCAAESCRALRLDDLLEGYLEKWAAAGGDDRAWQRLGDLSAEQKRWTQAAERYKKAWEKDRGQAFPLYLYGQALTQAGQHKEGQRWIEIAGLMCLGSEQRLAAFAGSLAERGLDDAADQAWKRLDRLALFSSRYRPYLARILAERALANKDYISAARHYRREVLQELWDSPSDSMEGQLWLAAAEHRCRARGVAVAGHFEEMRTEIKAVLDMEPGNIELAIDLVPELTKRGRKQEADELFTRIYAVQDAACKEFPQSAWLHNNTAWLAVRCRRDLDAALAHARKGVELDPDDSGHIDTLAEVHFQRGDRDKAIELMKKCIDIDPRSAYFRKQLKRMQAGDRDADVPLESSLAR